MNKMLPEKEYKKIAKKLIHAMCNSSLADKISNDPMRFGDIVNAVMMADWEWNGKGNIYGYRKQRAFWKLCPIIKNIDKEKGKHKVKQFSQFSTDSTYLDPLDKNAYKVDPLKYIDNEDYEEYVKDKITNSKKLTDDEKLILTDNFLNDISINDIAIKLGIHSKTVRQMIKKAMKKMGTSLCAS